MFCRFTELDERDFEGQTLKVMLKFHCIQHATISYIFLTFQCSSSLLAQCIFISYFIVSNKSIARASWQEHS